MRDAQDDNDDEWTPSIRCSGDKPQNALSNTTRLELIDYLLDGDVAGQADYLAADMEFGRPTTEREKDFAKLIMQIYRIVHPAFGNCVHEDWDQESKDLYVQMTGKDSHEMIELDRKLDDILTEEVLSPKK